MIPPHPTHSAAEMAAFGREIDRALGPVNTRVLNRLGLTRAEILAAPLAATAAEPTRTPDAATTPHGKAD